MVKIGTTVNLERRKAEILRDLAKADVYPDWLSSGFCENLHTLGIIQGSHDVETALHRALKNKALGKEWFTYDEEVEEVIDDLLSDHCCCDKCELLDKEFVNTL